MGPHWRNRAKTVPVNLPRQISKKPANVLPHSTEAQDTDFLTRATQLLCYPGRSMPSPVKYVQEDAKIRPDATTVLIRGLQKRPELNGRVAFAKAGPKSNGRWQIDVIKLDAIQRF